MHLVLLVGWQLGSSRVIVLNESTLDKRNHFLNRMSKICLDQQLSTLVLLKIGLIVVFF
jgi:hypothetical protein